MKLKEFDCWRLPVKIRNEWELSYNCTLKKIITSKIILNNELDIKNIFIYRFVTSWTTFLWSMLYFVSNEFSMVNALFDIYNTCTPTDFSSRLLPLLANTIFQLLFQLLHYILTLWKCKLIEKQSRLWYHLEIGDFDIREIGKTKPQSNFYYNVIGIAFIVYTAKN